MLPDADALLLSVIRAGTSAVTVGTQIPSTLLEKIKTKPFGTVKRIGGSAADPRYLDQATVDVQTWATSRKAAYDAAAVIRSTLLDAALDQTTFPLGHIARFVELSGISELRTADQAGGVWRFQATYSLFLRPAPGN